MGSRNDFNLNLHLSDLAGWLVSTLGKALIISTLIALAFGVAMVLLGVAPLAFFSGLVGVLVFGVCLYVASPPLPSSAE